MKRLVFILVLLMTKSSFGQSHTNVAFARNVLYLEVIGNTVGLSLNYEYLFEKYFSLRFGLGGHHCLCEYSFAPDFVSEDPLPPTSTALLIFMANFLTPKYPHHLEIGAGLMY